MTEQPDAPADPPRAGPRRARAPPSTSTRRPCCCPPAARTSTGCAPWPRGSATPGWSAPAARAWSPTPPRCSSRSPGCAATGATTARSSTTPGPPRAATGQAAYLSPDEILEIARQGAELGCTEALFTLGDRPEDRWPEAREWLRRARATTRRWPTSARWPIRVLEETGLLPHLNPGVMSWEEMNRLKPVSPSMGMMLETTSRRLFETKGEAHFGSPDKDPDVRVRVLEDAGRLSVPFTTGLLIGIGENLTERAESIFELRRVARQYGHVQEVIIQNFRAKPDTAMRHADDLGARGVPRRDRRLPDRARPQGAAAGAAQPGRPRGVPRAARRRRRRLGRRLAADPRPRQPRAPLALARAAALDHRRRPASSLRARLTAHPEYVLAGEPWIDPRVSAHVAALADDDGLVRDGVTARRPALAGARRRLRRASAAPTCTRPSTPRAAPTTAAPTSTTSTATGTRLKDRMVRGGRGRARLETTGRSRDARWRSLLDHRGVRGAQGRREATPATSATSTR